MMHRVSGAVVAAVVGVVVGGAAVDARGQCEPVWNEGFGVPGLAGVTDMAVFDDGLGGGPALYMAGYFREWPGTGADFLLRWDGSRWTPPAGSTAVLAGGATDLEVFDDGSGPALFVVANGIHKWTGSAWTSLPSPTAFGGGNSGTSGLHIVDEGTGPALFATGGGLAHRWDGSAWEPRGGGGPGQVSGMVMFDSGFGPRLHAVGRLPSNSPMAFWNGVSWQHHGGAAMTPAQPEVRGVVLFDPDGDGPQAAAMIVGGRFLTIGGRPISWIARWDGQEWHPLGEGVNGEVTALEVLDRGEGPRLFVGGRFTSAGGAEAASVAVWDGSAWSPMAGGVGGNDLGTTVSSFAAFDAGEGAEVYVGGGFLAADGVPASGVAAWDGERLRRLRDTSALAEYPGAMVVHPVDGRDQLVVATSGTGSDAGSVGAIAAWDGHRWAAVARRSNGSVRAMIAADLGDGPALYAAGSFGEIDGVGASNIARWDGAGWSALGKGLAGPATVNALATFDDGSGIKLYAAGVIYMPDGATRTTLAVWDGSTWSYPAPVMSSGGLSRVLAVFDEDGPGPLAPALFVGGSLYNESDPAIRNIARWDGQSWSEVGAGALGLGNFSVLSLAVFDEDGAGPGLPSLFVGGYIWSAGETYTQGIARWNGASWSVVGGGVPSVVQRLGVMPVPGAAGEVLVALTGSEVSPESRQVRYWDGAAWAHLGGVEHLASHVAAYDEDGDGPAGPALFVGGSFSQIAGVPSWRLARYSASPPRMISGPHGRIARPGTTLRLLAAASGAGPLAYRWRRDGMDLADDARVMGAATASLSITLLGAADGGDYDVVVTGPCGSIVSAAAAVEITCAADWNGDGAANTADISAFLTAWLLSLASGTAAADFSGNGTVNSSDISAFLTAWLAAVTGGC